MVALSPSCQTTSLSNTCLDRHELFHQWPLPVSNAGHSRSVRTGYHIEFKPGTQHLNADVLSRLPLPDVPKQIPLPGEVMLLMESLQALPVTSTQVVKWTNRDPALAKVRDNVQRGWQRSDEANLRPYQRRKDELSVEDGCVLWGRLVIVPPQGHAKALEMVHEGHPGASRTRSLARSFMWWPGMDGDVEDKVRACTRCRAQRKLPAPALLHTWEWPQRPWWSRLHADYARPFQEKCSLLWLMPGPSRLRSK